jgi:NADH-quinone oxidoreductase subunit M
MSQLPVVTLLLFTPLFAALLELLCLRKSSLLGKPALLISTLHLLAILGVWFTFPIGSADYIYYEQQPWIPSFGIFYAVGIDGLNLPFLALISGFVLLANIWNYLDENREQTQIFALVMVLQTAMIGAAVSLDLFLFGVFWELMLLPIFCIMVGYASNKKFANSDLEEGSLTIGFALTHQKRFKAAFGFLLYTMVGAAFMFIGILYLATNQGSFLLSTVKEGLELSSTEQTLLFIAFFLAFAVKIPIFPLHSWLPGAQRESPLTMGVIFTAVLFNMGIYGLVRFALPLFPQAAVNLAPVITTLSIASIIVGGLVALRQKDLKYLIAYSSISHLGFCLLGVSLLSTEALTASIFHSLAHGISAGGIFFIVGIIYERFGNRDINSYGGIGTVFPSLTVLFVITLLGYLAVPFTNGFVGEFTILYSAFTHLGFFGLLPIVGVVIGAIYGLQLTEMLFFGKPPPTSSDIEAKNVDQSSENFCKSHVFKLMPKESFVVIPSVLLTIYLGLFPNKVLETIKPVIDLTITNSRPFVINR